MAMFSKQFLGLAAILSWLWLSSGLMFTPAHAAVPGQTSPGIEDRQDRQQSLPAGTEKQSDDVSNGANQQQPFAVPPDTDTEHNQKLCESPELVVARCEPKPGSPLSASPLVMNLESPHPIASV
jgi:hypothetical protein